MRRLLNAVPLALIALPAAADFPPEVWFSPCSGPVATCVTPRIDHQVDHRAVGNCASEPALLGMPDPACDQSPQSESEAQGAKNVAAASSPYFDAEVDPAEPRRLQPIADNAYEMLARWENASKALFPVTDAERMRLRFTQPDLTGYQLSLACEFKQAVDAASLAERYEWTTFIEQGDIVSLKAVPKDELEALCDKCFIVDLDVSTGMPVGIRFDTVIRHGEGSSIVALRPWLDESENQIRLVGFETNTSDRRGVRTADLSDDAPRRLDGIESFTAPPAPRSFDCREPLEAPRPK